jgi:hypothetical protein
MKPPNSELTRWNVVVLFAVAMAWMESAVVLYLRRLVGRLEPYQARPLPDIYGLVTPEIIREAATMIMLACVGWLAGRTWRAKFGYWLLAFGVWDVFYYVFLRMLTGWPRTLLDWDVLFLIPLPWWGPVLAPALIAILMVAFGTLLVRSHGALWPTRSSVAATAVGVALVLWAFMYNALGLILHGATYELIRDSLPRSFPWLLFLPGVALMAVPIFDLTSQLIARKGLNLNTTETTT